MSTTRGRPQWGSGPVSRGRKWTGKEINNPIFLWTS